MKKLVLLFCIITSLFKAQDTLFYKNGDRRSVKVTEIGLAEIKFIYFNKPESPVYIVNKKEIKLIKYSNGTLDSVSAQDTDAPALISDVIGSKQLQIRSKQVYYMESRVSAYELNNLINEYPYPKNKEIMLGHFDKMKKHKRNEILFTMLIPVGVAIPLATSIWSVERAFGNRPDDYNIEQVFWSGVFIGAAFRISGFAFSRMFRNKYTNEKLIIARLYNEMK